MTVLIMSYSAGLSLPFAPLLAWLSQAASTAFSAVNLGACKALWGPSPGPGVPNTPWAMFAVH